MNEKLEVFSKYFLTMNISETWLAKEAIFNLICSIFYAFFNGVGTKFLWSEIREIQYFKNWKNFMFVKRVILAVFHFALEGFQCTAKDLFRPKSTFIILNFRKKLFFLQFSISETWKSIKFIFNCLKKSC